MRTTSEILKEFRKSREMTAAMMAEKLGISAVTMSAIDVGRKKLSEQMLDKLETMLPKDDFIDLLKSEREMNLPSFLQKKFEKYNIQSESITDTITNLTSENKEKAREYIELLEIKQEQK